MNTKTVENIISGYKKELMSDVSKWMSYLETASYHYKHPLDYQVMINVYMPEAMACGDSNTWNKLNRNIISENGIPITQNGEVGYLYDISQTEKREDGSSRTPWIWGIEDKTLNIDYSDTVNKVLSEKYDLKSNTLFENLYELAFNLTENSLSDNDSDYINLVAESTAYCVMTRCCPDKAGVSLANLKKLHEQKFDVAAADVNRIASGIMSEIEAVCKSERSKYIELRRKSNDIQRGKDDRRNTSRSEQSDRGLVSGSNARQIVNDMDIRRTLGESEISASFGEEAKSVGNNDTDEKTVVFSNGRSRETDSGAYENNGIDGSGIRPDTDGRSSSVLQDSSGLLEGDIRRTGTDRESSREVHNTSQRISDESSAGRIHENERTGDFESSSGGDKSESARNARYADRQDERGQHGLSDSEGKGRVYENSTSVRNVQQRSGRSGDEGYNLRLKAAEYGYFYPGMKLIDNKEEALSQYIQGKSVYLLYPDNTEGEAESRDEIEAFDGYFGIDVGTKVLEKDFEIFGNTTYRYIPKKTYRRYESETALKIAAELSKSDIKFSGKIAGEMTTLTFSKEDLTKVEQLAEEFANGESQEHIKLLTATKRGNFFEFYNEDAHTVAKELDLMLFSRDNAPMCGIAEHGISKALAQLKEKGYEVTLGEDKTAENTKNEPLRHVSFTESNQPHLKVPNSSDISIADSSENVKDNSEAEYTITQQDIDVLRTLEPRKSILNFTAEEIRLTENWQQRFEADIDRKSPYYRAVNGDWRENDDTKISILEVEDKNVDFKSVRNDIKSQVIYRGTVVNADTDWNIQISRNGLEDTVKYAFKYQDVVTYNLLYHIGDIVSNSILFDTNISEANNTNKAHNTAFMHKMYSLFRYHNELYLAKLAVEEFSDNKNGTLKRMYNVQDIKIEPLRHIEFAENQLARSILNNSDISIAELFAVVKSNDRDFYTNVRSSEKEFANGELANNLPKENFAVGRMTDGTYALYSLCSNNTIAVVRPFIESEQQATMLFSEISRSRTDTQCMLIDFEQMQSMVEEPKDASVIYRINANLDVFREKASETDTHSVAEYIRNENGTYAIGKTLIRGDYEHCNSYLKTLVNEKEFANGELESEAEIQQNEQTNLIHSAFEQLFANHNFPEQTEQFLRRTETFMAHNGYKELDPKMFKLGVFVQNYGTVSRIDDKLFDGKLKDIIKELNSALSEEKQQFNLRYEFVNDELRVYNTLNDNKTVAFINSDRETQFLAEDTLSEDIKAEVLHMAEHYVLPYNMPEPEAALPGEPIVTLSNSEHPEINGEMKYPLSQADRIMSALDEKQRSDREIYENAGWYHKTDFSIEFEIDGEKNNYEGRYDIGDGDGTITNHIKSYAQYMLKEENLKGFYDDETREEARERFSYILNELIPVLEKYSNAEKYSPVISAENYNTANADIAEYKSNGKDIKSVDIPITVSDELRHRFELFGLKPSDEQTQITLSTYGDDNWNRFEIRDKFGNRWVNVNATDILTPDELRTMKSVVSEFYKSKETERSNISDMLAFAEKAYEDSQKTGNNLYIYNDNNLQQMSLFGDSEAVPIVNSSSRATEKKKTKVVSNIAPTISMANHILRGGSNEPESLMRIVAYFQKGKTVEENARFLRHEFGTDGRGYKYTENSAFLLSAWFDNDGITYAVSNTAFPEGSNAHMDWNEAAERIEQLLENGEYCAQEIIDSAHQNELKDISSRLWNLKHDCKVNFFISDEIINHLYPDSVERISKCLEDKETLQSFVDGMSDFVKQYNADKSILNFNYHKPEELLERLTDLQREHKTFTTKKDFEFEPEFFVTEDEKDKLIGNGSSFAGGKFRIAEFFETEHTAKEKADFLKNEYGVGGSGRRGFNENHDSKGLEYIKGTNSSNPDCMVVMKWNEVAERVERLISEGKYITQRDIDSYVKSAKKTLENADPNSAIDKYSIEKAEKILEKYDTAPETMEILEDAVEPVSQLHEENSEISEALDTNVNENVTVSVAEAENYHINEDDLSAGGAKSQFKANLIAIQTLKAVEAEERPATPEEQKLMSRYAGWGGLSSAFDSTKSEWANEYAQLKDVLSDEEYTSARASVGDSFYTPPFIIDSIYTALKNMGFDGGNVLEPALGVGNFLGKMPEEMYNKSRIYGTELDSISGRIAKQLYPDADIAVTGFEKRDFSDGFFDVAVGNVPFGSFKIADRKYDKHNFAVHDYFFAKTLDKVRPGGIVAFVTSKGILNKANPAVRKYISQRAELLGAVRLPNNAFKSYAGTEVTSDIIFLQKREKMIDIAPEWVYTGNDKNGLPCNQYFIENPGMILGTTVEGNKLYGSGTMVVPFENSDLKELLNEAIQKIHGKYEKEKAVVASNTKQETEKPEVIPADPSVKNFTYTVIDDKLYYRENSVMTEMKFKGKKLDRVKGMAEINKCVRELLDMQLADYPIEDITEKQSELNTLHDNFIKEFGLLSSKANKSAFKEDISYPLLMSLEKVKDGELEAKADIFTKRTIRPPVKITHVDTAVEALAVSISEKACVDLGFMGSLMGGSDKIEQIVADLKGVIYKNPEKGDDMLSGWETADEYLSGNIREKLTVAQAAVERDELYSENVTALETVMPKRLEPGEINVKLGSSWIDTKYIAQFIYETLGTPIMCQGENRIDVMHSIKTATWTILNKSLDSSNVKAKVTYGTTRKNAYEIIEDSLNQRDTTVNDRVEDEHGNIKYVLNHKETVLARQKQEALNLAFRDWIFKDHERRDYLVEKYNVMFNSIRPREYDGSHLTFVGMNPEMELRPHQKNAVAHALYGGNTLFAHEVGAGKTYEMIATAMEGKRLGLCTKSLIAVPNHMTEQFANDFMNLYPNANILVAGEKDFSKENRQKLCSKIATGDFDAVIIGHSQLIKIAVSPEREEQFIREQIAEVTNDIAEIKAQNGERYTIKEMEKTKKDMEARLKKLLDRTQKDDVITFEQLGVDKLFIDEADMFKNLGLSTKMRNISGVAANTKVQKTQDLYLKCQYLDELTGGKGIVFATGTPVSNSISEIFTMQRYLQSDLLRKHQLTHFDTWAANFAEKVTKLEFAPEGTGFRQKTRLAKFFNLPELMTMFKECADIKTAEDLNLPTPECEIHNVAVQPTQTQKDLVASLGERAEKIHNKMVTSDVDNMLKITTDGRKIGLDQRLVNPMLPDEPGTKVNTCIDNVYRIWSETAENRSTQLVFCDYGVPSTTKTKTDKKGNTVIEEEADFSKFNVYDDIRTKLIERGVPENEIAFIHSAKTKEAKEKLFESVRRGDVKILIGSTSKMGAGTNVQNKLVASHDLDCPWKPRDMEQRRGRMVRQGNENEKVHLFRYVTQDTFDAYLFQTLENKQKFISQIMSSKTPARSCDDIDDSTLNYAEVKALCIANPHIKEKMELDIEVSKLQMIKSNFMNEHYRLEDEVLKKIPTRIAAEKEMLKYYQADFEQSASYPPVFDAEGKEKFYPMTVNGKVYAEKQEAGAALIEQALKVTVSSGKNAVTIGEYKGFKLDVLLDSFEGCVKMYIKGKASYSINMSESATGNITRIDNAINNIAKRIEETKDNISGLEVKLEDSKIELSRPFPQEQELNEKLARQTELSYLLNLDNNEDKEQAHEKSQEVQQDKKRDDLSNDDISI